MEDNGRGIDPAKIGRIAVERGFYTQGQIDKMSYDDKLHIIFKPGFSSAKEIDEISGRGLGLNIVKEKVEKMGGSIFVETAMGVGTTFKVQLPISRTLIRALLVKCGEQIYSIALDDIERLFSIPRNDLISESSYFVLNRFDGNTNLKVYDLRSSVLTPQQEKSGESSILNIVHIRKGSLSYGLIVNEFLRESELVVKKIDG